MRQGVVKLLLGVLTAAAAAAGSAAEGAVAAERENLRSRLEEGLRATRTLQADFVQVRKFARLSGEWRSHGRMAIAEDRLVWINEKPVLCCFVMTRETVRQWDEDTGKVLELSSRKLPWLRALYDGLQGWFRGDFTILDRDFVVSAADERTLLLAPKPDTFYQEGVKRLYLEFSSDLRYVERVRMEEKSGDEITILLDKVRINEAIPESLWQVPPVLKKP